MKDKTECQGKDIIYNHEGEYGHGEASHRMIRECAARFAASDDVLEEEILISDAGKPYFVNLDIFFSVTNCEAMWMCMMSDKPCGIDLQVMREVDFEALANRFFSERESEYVQRCGEEGFFDIWTRREAVAKMLGRSLLGELPDTVCEDGSLAMRLAHDGTEYLIREIEIGPGIKCAICSANEEYGIEFLDFWMPLGRRED